MAVVEKNHKYSPFQRRVINELPKLVGDRAYNYELCANNHMQILIQGVDKPIHCASTPSDSRAFANVSSEIRKRIKEADKPADGETSENPVVSVPKSSRLNKAYRHVIKAFRSNMDFIKESELEVILRGESLDAVEEIRAKFVATAIAYWLRQNRVMPTHFSQEELDSLNMALAKHLNFSLPTKAYYAQVKKESMNKIADEVNYEIVQDGIIRAVAVAIEELREDGAQFGDVKIDVEIDCKPFSNNFPDSTVPPAPVLTVGEHLTGAFEKAETQEALAAELKQFDASKLDLLIAACEAAKAEQKKEADMKEVIRMMEEKGLSLEQISAFLGAQAA